MKYKQIYKYFIVKYLFSYENILAWLYYKMYWHNEARYTLAPVDKITPNVAATNGDQYRCVLLATQCQEQIDVSNMIF